MSKIRLILVLILGISIVSVALVLSGSVSVFAQGFVIITLTDEET